MVALSGRRGCLETGVLDLHDPIRVDVAAVLLQAGHGDLAHVRDRLHHRRHRDGRLRRAHDRQGLHGGHHRRRLVRGHGGGVRGRVRSRGRVRRWGRVHCHRGPLGCHGRHGLQAAARRHRLQLREGGLPHHARHGLRLHGHHHRLRLRDLHDRAGVLLRQHHRGKRLGVARQGLSGGRGGVGDADEHLELSAGPLPHGHRLELHVAGLHARGGATVVGPVLHVLQTEGDVLTRHLQELDGLVPRGDPAASARPPRGARLLARVHDLDPHALGGEAGVLKADDGDLAHVAGLPGGRHGREAAHVGHAPVGCRHAVALRRQRGRRGRHGVHRLRRHACHRAARSVRGRHGVLRRERPLGQHRRSAVRHRRQLPAGHRGLREAMDVGGPPHPRRREHPRRLHPCDLGRKS
mmetsp:Transcript_11142/g.32915  ORF Transcript_11142/g.32915 Transcript_11142/m.32915 type:complete len:408 (-) Transcript_11142:2-1225(-)